jgi:type I restriction enzyme S subunit
MIEGLQPYPEYRESGLPWLEKIPTGWRVSRNGSLFQQRNDTQHPNLPVLEVSLRTGVRVRDFESSKRKQVMADAGKYKRANAGDIAYNMMRMWQGAVGVAPVNGLVSPAYVVAKPISGSVSPYYAALFRSGVYMGEIDAASRGIVKDRNRLYWDQFKQMQSLVPPPDEQTAIVRFLDHANRKIDGFIRAKRKLIALLGEQKQAIIHRVVTRGLNPNVPLKPSGIPWLGDIPQHWELKRAKQVCSRIVDCKNRTPDMIDGGEFTVVRTTNIRNGVFNLRGSYPTDRRNFDIWTERGAPRHGDVFFTREAPVGEACLVPNRQDLCMGQRMMYFRPDPEVLDAEFLLHSIYGPVVRTYLEHAVNGSTVGNLRLGQVGAIPLLWCPVTEQKQIVAHINREFAPLDTVIARTEREIALMQEYRTW